MGLRGPGAKSRKKPAEEAANPKRQKRPAWEKRGLSRAERVIAFIETLPITSGSLEGQKMALRPWQRDIVEAIYRTNDDGKRPVRTALITVPRKNGKTALVAGLALAHLVGPEAERRGQVYSAAADKNQAAIIFREMEAIIAAIPEFAERVNIQRFAKVIEDMETGSVYQALSSDAKTKHGFSASFIVYDELAQAPNRELYDVLTTSTAARAEPLAVVISTQNSDPHHIMSELVDYGQQVLDGVVDDPTFHATIYAAPMDADPWDEATWYACNPALGDFRSLEEMRTTAAQARRIPAREATFRNLYLNQKVDCEQRFIPKAEWDACTGAVDIEELRGRPCWGGLDLSSTTDLTAFVLFFPEDKGAVLPVFWAPKERLHEREDHDRVPYPLWEKQGFLRTTSGRAIDKWAVARDVAELAGIFDLQGLAFDRWRFEDFQKILVDEGIELPLKQWGQGYRDMGPAVDALESAILDRRIRQDQHPVLTWCCSNVKVSLDPAGARKFDKDKSRERIDGMQALCMAVGLWAREPKPEPVEFKFAGWL